MKLVKLSKFVVLPQLPSTRFVTLYKKFMFQHWGIPIAASVTHNKFLNLGNIFIAKKVMSNAMIFDG